MTKKVMFTIMDRVTRAVRCRIYDELERQEAIKIAISYANVTKSEVQLYDYNGDTGLDHIVDITPDSWEI